MRALRADMTRRRLIWAVATVVVLLRLYLTGDRDILALNSPHDEFWYIENAFNGIWGGHYNEMTLIHLPVYSAWLASLDLLGIPARLAIDTAWLAATGYLALAVARLTRASWAGLLLFAFLAFHPYVIRIFDRALAETLLTVLTAAVLGAGIELWRCRSEPASKPHRIASTVYIAGFALAYHTRTEGIVLLAPLLLLGCWSLYDRRNWWRRGGQLKSSLTMLALPLAATLVLGGLLSAANFAKWGVWASQELAAPGYKSAMAALASIDTGRTPKQVTVTREMLASAFRESPTFRQLKPVMDGSVGAGWVAIAAPYVPEPGEIGNGWFYWALRDVAAKAGWHADARLAESRYAAMASELNRAFDEGRLKRRRMFSSFVDPDVGKWVPDVPASLAAVTRLLVQPRFDYVDSPTENASPRQLDRYTAVSERRHPLPRIALAGWLRIPPGSSVGLGASDGDLRLQPLGAARTDVPDAFGFAVSLRDSPAPATLVVRMPDGGQRTVAVASLQAGRTATLEGGVVVGIDRIETNLQAARADEWLPALSRLYVILGYLCCALIGLACIVELVRLRRSAVVGLVALCLAGVVARIALLAVLDASSWNGTQARYIMPVISFAGCAAVCSLLLLVRGAAEPLRRQTAGSHVQNDDDAASAGRFT